MKWEYVYDPHSGGTKIPPIVQEELRTQALAYACTRPWHPKIQLHLRFKSQYCYVDTMTEGDDRVFPLCRLRYFRRDGLSLALFTYSNERYEPCYLSTGKGDGTLADALATCDPFII
jgi:hypothetical protein